MVEGVVREITKNSIIIDTITQGTFDIPRYFGEIPRPGTAVVVDFSSGSPVIFLPVPITKVEPENIFLNFYAEEEEPEPEPVGGTGSTSGGDSGGGDEDEMYAPFVPNSFKDSPIGAKTLPASNGNLVFSGPTAVGMAVSCEGKYLIRDDGLTEEASAKYVGIRGKTVIASSFIADVHIEIEISNEEIESDISFTELKIAIAKDIEEASTPLTFEEAYEKNKGDFESPDFLDVFGLQIGEILATHKWQKVTFHGAYTTFQSIFSGIATFTGVEQFCEKTEDIVSFEIYLSDNLKDVDYFSAVVPSCEEEVKSFVYAPFVTLMSENYNIGQVNIRLSDGTFIEYFGKKRTYGMSVGTISKANFSSSTKSKTYSELLHVDSDKMVIPNLSFSSGNGFCGTPAPLPEISWDGDFNFEVTGRMRFASDGKATVSSLVETVLVGATRGIKIDKDGSSAITT